MVISVHHKYGQTKTEYFISIGGNGGGATPLMGFWKNWQNNGLASLSAQLQILDPPLNFYRKRKPRVFGGALADDI